MKVQDHCHQLKSEQPLLHKGVLSFIFFLYYVWNLIKKFNKTEKFSIQNRIFATQNCKKFCTQSPTVVEKSCNILPVVFPRYVASKHSRHSFSIGRTVTVHKGNQNNGERVHCVITLPYNTLFSAMNEDRTSFRMPRWLTDVQTNQMSCVSSARIRRANKNAAKEDRRFWAALATNMIRVNTAGKRFRTSERCACDISDQTSARKVYCG